jgi:hypothetical protein
MITRRAFLGGVAGGLLARLLAAEAQPAEKVYRIGLLTLASDPSSPLWLNFLAAMRQRNYVEGRNLTVTRAFAEGKTQRLPGLVADLEAFYQEHRRCGALDGGVERGIVWMACWCGAKLARPVGDPPRR